MVQIVDLVAAIEGTPLITIQQKVDPRSAALIVVDVQNDFCAPGGGIANENQDVSAAVQVGERLPSFINAAREAGVLVVFVRTLYGSGQNFYLSETQLEHAARRRPGRFTRRPFCLEGSWGAEFYGQVRPEPSDPIVTKHRYSAFYKTDLDTILQSHRTRTLILTGVATNVCVGTTAHDGYMRDYHIVVVTDGTASYDETQHEVALKDIDRYYGEIKTISEISSMWQQHQHAL